MTENEAKQVLDNIWDFVTPEDDCLGDFVENALYVVDSIFEEIQQYRAIGLTPTMVQDTIKARDIAQKRAIENAHIVDDYQEIGTIEEFKALKEKEERFDRNIRMFNEIGLEIRAKAIDGFAHQLKENLNQEFPRNYESTRPYFSLENARLIVDDVAEQMKAGGIDG